MADLWTHMLEGQNIVEADKLARDGDLRHLGVIARNNIIIAGNARLDAENAARDAAYDRQLREREDAIPQLTEAEKEERYQRELEALADAAHSETSKKDAYRNKPLTERTVDQLDLRGPNAADDFFNSF